MKCNIFRFLGKYYSQIRGLVMGQRLAPVLAVFMGKIGEPVLERLPSLYCRYINDCCVITSTQSEMDECFKILNEQLQHIELIQETTGQVTSSNTQMHLYGSTDVLRKLPESSYCTLNWLILPQWNTLSFVTCSDYCQDLYGCWWPPRVAQLSKRDC